MIKLLFRYTYSTRRRRRRICFSVFLPEIRITTWYGRIISKTAKIRIGYGQSVPGGMSDLMLTEHVSNITWCNNFLLIIHVTVTPQYDGRCLTLDWTIMLLLHLMLTPHVSNITRRNHFFINHTCDSHCNMMEEIQHWPGYVNFPSHFIESSWTTPTNTDYQWGRALLLITVRSSMVKMYGF